MKTTAIMTSGSVCRTRVSGNEITKYIEVEEEGIENGSTKLYYEALHMQERNDSLPDLYPKILKISKDDKFVKVTSEYTFSGYTLSDVLQNEKYNIEYFKRSINIIFNNLFDRLYSHRKDNIKVNETYIFDCYLGRMKTRVYKTIEILEKTGFSDKLKYLLENTCYINGVKYAKIIDYIDYLENDGNLIEKLSILHNTESHHDLILGNVLVKLGKDYVEDFRLIDPRGEKETGENNRNCMYDVGKMLFAIDTYEIIRIFNGKKKRKLYKYDCKTKEKYIFELDITDDLVVKYIKAKEYFWEMLKDNNFYKSVVDEEYLELKFKFSEATMHISDVPCRVIDEKDEEMCICFYLRGLQLLKQFIIDVYGCDLLIQIGD